MNVIEPKNLQISALRALWREAFDDDDDYLDDFFSTAFSTKRCRCVEIESEIAAALYWFDCSFHERKLAYIYSVATAKAYRGVGICHSLMQHTHNYLRENGYIGAVLVPGSSDLFAFYERMGYVTSCYVEEFSSEAASESIYIEKIGSAEYASLRRKYLPDNGVIQENENIALLASQAELYKGDDFLLAAEIEDGMFKATELLGNTAAASGILKSLGYQNGNFRTVGECKPFAMYLPFSDSSLVPKYFGLAFD